MFEGIALGTRIAALGQSCLPTAPTTTGHNHAHGHEHYHDHDPPAPTSESPETKPPAATTSTDESHSTTSTTEQANSAHVSMRYKLILASAFAVVTPVGLGIGIGVLQQFNGNDPSTIIAIGTLDALSAGILVWVGVVEMWAHDWMLGGEMTRASPLRTVLGLVAMVVGMGVMSLLGKWA
jgi:zinc transporter 1/2/3